MNVNVEVSHGGKRARSMSDPTASDFAFAIHTFPLMLPPPHIAGAHRN
jgi:hypothetical protein